MAIPAGLAHLAVRVLAAWNASGALPCRCRTRAEKPSACYLIVPVQLLDTAWAKCQTCPVFERFSKAFPS